jgi:UDP-glucose 4-epimerase
MRVAVVGASGNVGTSLLETLADEPEVEEVIGIARRRPRAVFSKTTWVEADIERDELVRHFRGADAVVHLAWRIQPSRDLPSLSRTNVEGSTRVFRAVAEAGVPALVYASSVGVYSRGPKDEALGESWPRDGVATSFYARHKAEVERRLDRFEEEIPGIRVVRLRPGLIFKREAASGVRRLFLGPFLPSPLVRRGLIGVVPAVPGLRFQAVHSLDVGDAYRLAIVREVHGAFNIAAEPVLDARELARALGARAVPLPAFALRAAASLTWQLHLQPSPPGWIDLALGVPILDVRRARDELGWKPRVSATEAFAEVAEGLRERAGIDTPPLDPDAGGPARSQEILTGVGERER